MGATVTKLNCGLRGACALVLCPLSCKAQEAAGPGDGKGQDKSRMKGNVGPQGSRAGKSSVEHLGQP